MAQKAVNPEKIVEEVPEKITKSLDSVLLAPLIMGNKVADAMAAPVKPILQQSEMTKNMVDRLNRKLREEVTKILFTTRHDNLLQAMVADLVDVIPGLGDITSAERLADARYRGDRDAITAHGMDTFVDKIFDFIPVVGEFAGSVLDALLPANTLLYLKRRGIIEWEPPLPPLPKINLKSQTKR